MTRLLILPDRTELRGLFDEEIAKLNPARGGILTTGYYARVGDAVFETGCAALADSISGEKRMHTIAAPAGGGKTSFSYALIAAVTRYAETRPDSPYGIVVVVDEIEKADKAFRELNALLPGGKVAVWTSDHDPSCKTPEKVETPAARFERAELRHYPVVIVTHKFYLGTNGRHAHNVVHGGHMTQRALTIVDERPDEAPTLDISLPAAEEVRHRLVQEHPDTKDHMDALLHFMEKYSYADANKLYRPGIEIDQDKLASDLRWFTTPAAERLCKSAASVPGIEALFAFGKALASGMGCVATSGEVPFFFGWSRKRIVDLAAGTILLDATADIDGVSLIAPWRCQVQVPPARYDNLKILHVPQHTKRPLSEYLKKATNERAYVAWMIAAIMEHMNPGERGLVICKKLLIDHEAIPSWGHGDQRFQVPKTYAEDYGWDLNGRRLCVTHWGAGIGSNAWKDADVVFLFDEFILPKRVAVATAQGYREHKASEGDLGSMKTMSSKAEGVSVISDGHALRHIKQLALRGRARFYDERGVCGRQRLVIGCDLKRFMSNAKRLFPGAAIKVVGNPDDQSTWSTKVLQALCQTDQQVITSKELSKIIGRPWREVSRNVVTEEFRGIIADHGWRYDNRKGRLGARFERIRQRSSESVSDGALSAYVRA